jgi:hypothetical protein
MKMNINIGNICKKGRSIKKEIKSYIDIQIMCKQKKWNA